jgi:hypothetical protein
VGHRVGKEAGVEGHPIWGSGKEEAHQGQLSMVRRLSGGKLAVAGRRRGEERRQVRRR